MTSQTRLRYRDEVILCLVKNGGGFVDTDGEWCTCDTPLKLNNLIQFLGFETVAAYEKGRCSACVEFKHRDQIGIACWNGAVYLKGAK
jgi:hypothetical protein